jgi:glycosyltransferase involved in cell wall biosynthesis
VGGIPETLEDPDILVNPYDEIDIEDKLRRVVEMSATERKNIGSANREKILKRFTLDLHVEKLKKIYQDFTISHR